MEYPLQISGCADSPWQYRDDLGGKELLVHYLNMADYSIGMHSHDYCEINIITQGEGAHYYSGHIFEVSEGDVFVIPPGIKHGYWNCGGLNVFHVLLHPNFFIKYESDLIDLPGYFALFDISPQIRIYTGISRFMKFRNDEYKEIFDIIGRNIKLMQKPPLSKHDVIGLNVNTLFLITRMTSFFCRELFDEEKYKNTSDSLLFTKAVERIMRDFDRKLDVDELAEDLHISRSTYYLLFRKYSGKTPGEYIANVRLTKAKSLLLSTDDSITAIALLSGYFDASHFNHAFKKQTGISPGEFRAMNGK